MIQYQALEHIEIWDRSLEKVYKVNLVRELEEGGLE